MVVMNKNLNAVCVAHGKDVDGISSASLVKLATGADVYLVNYDGVIDVLQGLDSRTDLYVCDLGMNESIANDFLAETKRIARDGRVTYIDHHPLNDQMKRKLEKVGVNLVHSTQECAGVLTHQHLKEKLPRRAALLACYAAVTDYLDNQPIAKALIGSFDRQLILLESTMLAYALTYEGTKISFGNRIVREFQALKFPHEMNGIPMLAKKQAGRMKSILERVGKDGKQYGNFAYIESDESSLGLVANLLIGEFSVPIALAYRRNPHTDMIEMSLRGRYDSEFKLGEIISRITKKVGGMGGGHAKASGARIPGGSMQEFLDRLKKELSRRPRASNTRTRGKRRKA